MPKEELDPLAPSVGNLWRASEIFLSDDKVLPNFYCFLDFRHVLQLMSVCIVLPSHISYLGACTVSFLHAKPTHLVFVAKIPKILVLVLAKVHKIPVLAALFPVPKMSDDEPVHEVPS